MVVEKEEMKVEVLLTSVAPSDRGKSDICDAEERRRGQQSTRTLSDDVSVPSS